MGNILKGYDKEPIRVAQGARQSYSTMSILSSIAQIAAKYNLDPRLLLDTFTEAWTHKESQYEKLEIESQYEKAKVATFYGMLQLRIGRSGIMSVDTSTRVLTTAFI